MEILKLSDLLSVFFITKISSMNIVHTETNREYVDVINKTREAHVNTLLYNVTELYCRTVTYDTLLIIVQTAFVINGVTCGLHKIKKNGLIKKERRVMYLINVKCVIFFTIIHFSAILPQSQHIIDFITYIHTIYSMCYYIKN